MSPPPAKKPKTNGDNNNFNRKKILVQTGQRGFLATCNYQEKGCIRECFNVLAHYANFVYGAECEIPQVEEIKDMEELQADDISDELQREINVAQHQSYKPKKARFLALDTGAINTVFIRTTLQDPVQLGTFIVRDILNTKAARTRALIRLIPIEVVCTAGNIQAIVNAVDPIFDKYFVKVPCTYSIVVNRRLNNSIERGVIIRELAALVRIKNKLNSVDLRNPAKTIIVEIIKGICMIGVLPSYFKYKKYNLIECSRSENTADDIDAITSAPSLMESVLLPPKTEESPESPVEEEDVGAKATKAPAIEEIIEEPMEGPIEEPTDEITAKTSDDQNMDNDEDKDKADNSKTNDSTKNAEKDAEHSKEDEEEKKDEKKDDLSTEEIITKIPPATVAEATEAANDEKIEKEDDEEKEKEVPVKSNDDENNFILNKNEPNSIENANNNDNNKNEEEKTDTTEKAKISICMQNDDGDNVKKVVTNDDDKNDEMKPENVDDNDVLFKEEDADGKEKIKGDNETVIIIE